MASTLELTSEVGAARRARAWVREALPGMIAAADDPESALLADAVLCANELVNASLVARSTTMTLQLRRDQHALRVSVFDDGSADIDDQDATAHAQQLSFRMLDALVERWGIDTTADGRELWVTLSLDDRRARAQA